MSQYGYGYGGYGSGGGFNFRWLIALIIAAVGIIGYLTHTQVNPVTGQKQHITISPRQEVAMGRQVAPQMASQMGGDVDPRADPRSAEVQKIGRQLVERSDAGRSPYAGDFQYHLLNDTKVVNAFALPGGQVFITRALFDKLQDEAQLAGVLGHETGHVIARHGAEQMEKTRLGQTLVTATGVGASGSRNGQIEAMAAAYANQMLQLHYSRDDELQADALGMKFMAQAGYDPREMLGVMHVLQALEQQGHPPEMLSTHPMSSTRIQQVNELLKNKDYFKDPQGRPIDVSRLGKGLPLADAVNEMSRETGGDFEGTPSRRGR